MSNQIVIVTMDSQSVVECNIVALEKQNWSTLAEMSHVRAAIVQ
jgi:hypothetical protein